MGDVITLTPRRLSGEAGGFGLLMPMPQDPVDACEAGMLMSIMASEHEGSCTIHRRNAWMASRTAMGRQFRVDELDGDWVEISVLAKPSARRM